VESLRARVASCSQAYLRRELRARASPLRQRRRFDNPGGAHATPHSWQVRRGDVCGDLVGRGRVPLLQLGQRCTEQDACVPAHRSLPSPARAIGRPRRLLAVSTSPPPGRDRRRVHRRAAHAMETWDMGRHAKAEHPVDCLPEALWFEVVRNGVAESIVASPRQRMRWSNHGQGGADSAPAYGAVTRPVQVSTRRSTFG
jgi:hypothetical protein